MRASVFILLLMLAISPATAQQGKKKESGLSKVLHSMFPSARPEVKQVKSSKSHRHGKATVEREQAKPTDGSFTVDPEWMARYWEQEALWDYYIPEDNKIKFVDGKYVVSLVVYKHYEDMLNTVKR